MAWIEWDPRKAAANRLKHGIDFETASLVFEDPLSLTDKEQGTEHGEIRWRTTGQVVQTTIIVSHTRREEGGVEIVRIISARKATRSERRRYEEGA